MKIDAEVFPDSPAEIPGLARKAEGCGFDCVWFNETKHDPFVQLALAAVNTQKIQVGTSIALAFTRSPTTLAYSAWDIQSLSKGRMILGLGSQVKGHIERRFGMKWESPAPKMKEVVKLLREVWENWQTGETLDFQGKFFKVNLMTPFFSPPPNENPRIPVYLAGVNRGMCRLAGEMADGLHVHPLHTVRYLREVVKPALSKGIFEVGRNPEEVSVAASVFAAVGASKGHIGRMRESFKEQIAFYASTRAYRPLMELHGWGDVADRLRELSFRGEWGRMGSEVGEDMLEEFVVEGTWESIGKELEKRYSGLVDRVRLYLPFDGDPVWKQLVDGFHA
ncbi:MAG: TIGR03617 family F420-dependent LLM class oxidoreductase [Thaumarchaeota archaeon]|nr:TIGR03617 family F420-dependent LLM class oxidoreductase [Nitrososphaerota archaeon]